MIDSNIIERIISSERIEPYLKYHEFDHHKAFATGEDIHRAPFVAQALVVLVERIAVSRFLLLRVIELQYLWTNYLLWKVK